MKKSVSCRYAKWMQYIKLGDCDIRINEIALPGTHNSGAYQILPIALDSSALMRHLCTAMLIVPGFSKLIGDWTINQDANIKDQLERGVRALDLRITYNNSDKTFYISHYFACTTLDEILLQIKQFMDENQGEIVVVTIKPDWDHRTTMIGHEKSLVHKLEATFGNMLCPALNSFADDRLKVKNLLANNHRLLISYEGSEAIYSPNIWNSSKIKSYWLDAGTEQQWLQKFATTSIRHVPATLCRIEVTITPNAGVIKNNAWKQLLLQTPLQEMALGIQKHVIPILSKSDGCGIVAADFIKPTTIQKIIKHNYLKIMTLTVRDDALRTDNSQQKPKSRL